MVIKQKPLLVIRSDIFNGFVPLTLRNFLYSGLTFFLVYWLLKSMSVFVLIPLKISWFVLASILFAIFPLAYSMIIAINTKYIFYHDRIESEFKFFNVKKMSAPYLQIANISSDITFWDRMCNAGDITLYTTDDTAPNFNLMFIKNPQKIEAAIYAMINKNKSQKR